LTPARQISAFRIVAFAEAISWAGLLTGMGFKYLTDAGELGVRVFGPIHGGIFVIYGLLTLLVARTQRWSLGTTLLGLAAAVPPFATAVFEVWAQRSGRLVARSAGRTARTRSPQSAGSPSA
jgi:integral membrane protein